MYLFININTAICFAMVIATTTTNVSVVMATSSSSTSSPLLRPSFLTTRSDSINKNMKTLTTAFLTPLTSKRITLHQQLPSEINNFSEKSHNSKHFLFTNKPTERRNLSWLYPSSSSLLSKTCLSASKRGKTGGAMARKKKKTQKASSSSSSSGFSFQMKPKPKPKSKSGSIYSLPALYDLAFGYRNYDEEVSFLLYAHSIHSNISKEEEKKNKQVNVLELGAGPARHCLAALLAPDETNYNAGKEGGEIGFALNKCTAVDNSAEMIAYATDLANRELGVSVDEEEEGESDDGESKRRRDDFNYILGDMRNFSSSLLNENAITYDTAWILLGSMAHLISNNDVISCFKSINKVLQTGGTLIIELPHPRETFSMGECTRNGWEVPLEDEGGEEYGALKVIWGDDDDVFDPVRQVRDFTVALELDGVDEEKDEQNKEYLKSVREVVPMRLFTSREIDALATCSGFTVEAMYGALNEEVDVNDEEEAFRLVCVLRKL